MFFFKKTDFFATLAVVIKDLIYNRLLLCFLWKQAIEILGRVKCADFTVGKWNLRVRGELANFENELAKYWYRFQVNPWKRVGQLHVRQQSFCTIVSIFSFNLLIWIILSELFAGSLIISFKSDSEIMGIDSGHTNKILLTVLFKYMYLL
jgi:hypothetical protein